jgi:hypothetical protein
MCRLKDKTKPIKAETGGRKKQNGKKGNNSQNRNLGRKIAECRSK